MKVWKWLCAVPWSWILTLGSLVSAYFIWRSKKNVIETFEEAKEAQALRESIRNDQREADKLLQSANAHAHDIEILQKDIAASQKSLLAMAVPTPAGEIRKMSDDEVSQALSSLGF